MRIEVNGRLRAEQWVSRTRLIARWERADGLVEAEEQVSAALEATEAPDELSREAVGVTLATAPITLGMRVGTGERERDLVTIQEPAGAATWLGVTEADLLALPGAFLDHAGAWWAPWAAAVPLAQMVVAAHPDPVLDLIQIERQHMDWMRIGGSFGFGLEDMVDTDLAEDFWHPSTETHRTGFELRDIAYDLVRSWCGAGPLARYDEMVALRDEVTRLRGVIDGIATEYEASGDAEKAKALDDLLNRGPDGHGPALRPLEDLA